MEGRTGRTRPFREEAGDAEITPGAPWSGRGAWIWELFPQIGSVENAIALAHEKGVEWVAIKSNDDGRRDGFRAAQTSRAIVDQFHEAGIGVYYWGYAYDGWQAFVDAAGDIVEETGADGYIVDLEQEAENAGIADQLAAALKERLPDTPLAVAPQPVIRFHERMDVNAWADRGYVLMPQMYWTDLGGNRPGSYGDLEALFAEWRTRAPGARLVPIMSGTGLTVADAPDVAEFIERAGPDWSFWRADNTDAAVLTAALEAT